MLLKNIAELLTNDDLQRGVVEEIIDRESLFALLPFVQTEGKAYVYNREKTLAGASFLDPNEVIPEESSDVESVTTHLKIIAGDVDVDKFLDATMSNYTDQKSLQIAMKAKGVGRMYKEKLITGDSGVNAKEFDGIDKILTDINGTTHGAGQQIVVGANGASLDLAMIDELIDAIPNGPDAIMMRSGTFRALKELWRGFGGNTGGMMQLENFGLMVPAHDGVPIIINDFIPGDVDQGTATDTCSIYALRANEVDGLHGLYGGGLGGFVIEDIGTVQNKDATRTRIKWYTGLALKSTQSLAGLRGITDI